MKADAKDQRRIVTHGVTARVYLSLRAAKQAAASLRANGWQRIAVLWSVAVDGTVHVTAARDLPTSPWMAR